MSVEKIIQLNGLDKLATSRTHRRALLLAMLVIAAVALYRWILAPYGGQLLAVQQYDFALAGVLHKARILNTMLEAKKAKLKELTAEAVRLRSELFTPGEAREFFASLPAVANRTGCVIQSVSSPTEQRGGSTSSPADGSGIIGKKAIVAYSGGYGNIVAFIEELQTYQRKVWIDSVRIEAGGNAGKLKCQLTLTLCCADNMETASYE
ncbi:MAG: hypothetical protein ABII09_12830 [Planctomycetota bacterium]